MKTLWNLLHTSDGPDAGRLLAAFNLPLGGGGSGGARAGGESE